MSNPNSPFGSYYLRSEIPYFSGQYVDWWLYHLECYFIRYQMEEHQKLAVATSYLIGEGLEWYRQWYRDIWWGLFRLGTWNEFVRDLKLRFKPPEPITYPSDKLILISNMMEEMKQTLMEMRAQNLVYLSNVSKLCKPESAIIDKTKKITTIEENAEDDGSMDGVLDECAAAKDAKHDVTIFDECSGNARLLNVVYSEHIAIKEVLVEDRNSSVISCTQGVCKNAHENLSLYLLPTKPSNEYLKMVIMLNLKNTWKYDLRWGGLRLRTFHGLMLSSVQHNLQKPKTCAKINMVEFEVLVEVWCLEEPPWPPDIMKFLTINLKMISKSAQQNEEVTMTERKPISKILFIVARQTLVLPFVENFGLTKDSNSVFSEGVPWIRYHGTYKELTTDLILRRKDPNLGVGTAGGFKATVAFVGEVYLTSKAEWGFFEKVMLYVLSTYTVRDDPYVRLNNGMDVDESIQRFQVQESLKCYTFVYYAKMFMDFKRDGLGNLSDEHTLGVCDFDMRSVVVLKCYVHKVDGVMASYFDVVRAWKWMALKQQRIVWPLKLSLRSKLLIEFLLGVAFAHCSDGNLQMEHRNQMKEFVKAGLVEVKDTFTNACYNVEIGEQNIKHMLLLKYASDLVTFSEKKSKFADSIFFKKGSFFVSVGKKCDFKAEKKWLFMTTVKHVTLQFGKAEKVYYYGECYTGICYFTLPRPPEASVDADLEDKVNFKGRGMLRMSISGTYGT